MSSLELMAKIGGILYCITIVLFLIFVLLLALASWYEDQHPKSPESDYDFDVVERLRDEFE